MITVDQHSTIAEAVAIHGGRFVAVGTSADIRRLVGAATRVIDAGGRTVIPGLIDSHVHALGVAAAETAQPFQDLTSIAQMQAWIRHAASAVPAGAGSGRRASSRRESRSSGSRRAQSSTLRPPPPRGRRRRLRVDGQQRGPSGGVDRRRTPDPPGGAIVRGAMATRRACCGTWGRCSRNSVATADDTLPSLDALERVHEAYNRVGITSVGERAGEPGGIQGLRGLAQRRPPARARDGDHPHTQPSGSGQCPGVRSRLAARAATG